MSYDNLFIGDFSDDDKNKIYLKEPLESNSVRFEKDGFTIKLENGVELIHRENGIVIRAARNDGAKVYKRETPDGTTQLECPKCHHEALKEWHHPHCWNCGQKLDWAD